MQDNRATLARLLVNNAIAMRQSDVLREPVSAPPADFDRVAGMLLGVAIGDALGRPSEGMIPSRWARCMVAEPGHSAGSTDWTDAIAEPCSPSSTVLRRASSDPTCQIRSRTAGPVHV